MRIAETYSHLNGLEFLLVHKPKIWTEIQTVIRAVDAQKCKTKISKEKTKVGKVLYSPIAMNQAIKDGFGTRRWGERRVSYWVTKDSKLIRQTMHLSAADQKQQIEDAGETPIYSYNQTDFVKDRVAVEVQFGKYSFVAFDLFVKHLGACPSNRI